jgi:hypothetical protein
MRTKSLFGVAILLILFVSAPVRAQAQYTTLQINNITVTNQGGGMFYVDVQCTFTLGVNDTYVSNNFSFTDPNGNNVTPTNNFTAPTAGNSCTFNCTCNTSVTGQWTANIIINYKNGNGDNARVTQQQNFNVSAGR